MAKFRIKFNTERLDKALAKAPKIVSNELAKGMLKAGILFGQNFKKERLSNKSVLPDGLRARTGFLRQSIRSEVKGKGREITNIVSIGGPTAPYARIHEKGGVIRAKGKLLTFAPDDSPLKKVAARTTKRPRDVPNLTFIPSRKTRGGVWVKKAKRGVRGPIYFISVEKVRIPARLKWVKTFQSSRTEKIYEDNVRRAITKGLRLAKLASA